MSLDNFWFCIEAQLEALTTARTATDVIRILAKGEGSTTEGFFGGSGGDGSVEGSLDTAGWRHVWREAHYYWCMKAPDGTLITYVEGDVFIGNQHPSKVR